jgi:hypothetical protein
MMKKLLQVILGVVASVGCVASLYFYLLSLNANGNIFLLILFFALGGFSVFIFIRVNRIPKTATDNLLDPSTTTPQQPEGTLAKNNALLNDWKKTNDTKDRLRMLEIGAAAEESDK